MKPSVDPLKTEHFQGFKIEFFKAKVDGKSAVYAVISDDSQYNNMGELHRTPLKYKTKGDAWREIRDQIDEGDLKQKLKDIKEEKRKKEKEADAKRYDAYNKEIVDAVNSISKKHGFEYKDMSYEHSLNLQYVPIFTTYERSWDTPYVRIDAKTGEIEDIHYNLPDNINYNGFGPSKLENINMKNIKNLSKEYERLIMGVKNVGREFKMKKLGDKLESIRNKYYPKRNR